MLILYLLFRLVILGVQSLSPVSLVTPRTVALQAPLSMGFSSQENWSGLPCPPPGFRQRKQEKEEIYLKQIFTIRDPSTFPLSYGVTCKGKFLLKSCHCFAENHFSKGTHVQWQQQLCNSEESRTEKKGPHLLSNWCNIFTLLLINFYCQEASGLIATEAGTNMGMTSIFFW